MRRVWSLLTIALSFGDGCKCPGSGTHWGWPCSFSGTGFLISLSEDVPDVKCQSSLLCHSCWCCEGPRPGCMHCQHTDGLLGMEDAVSLGTPARPPAPGSSQLSQSSWRHCRLGLIPSTPCLSVWHFQGVVLGSVWSGGHPVMQSLLPEG